MNNTEVVPEQSLMQRTRQLLDEHCRNKESLPAVFAAISEKGITFPWLRKFKSGKIRNPSVNNVQVLYEYLTGEPLIEDATAA